MRIIVAHNFYQQAGGEDQVYAAEKALLREHGHDVAEFSIDNFAVEGMGKLALAQKTIWNKDTSALLSAMIQAHGAQLVHFHNTFPIMSPSVYYAARRAGAAVVQTLHNYRLLCPAATCYRDGKVCEQCVGKAPLAAVLHKCYRQSLPVTAVASASLMFHRMRGTYQRVVDAYIALTQFARDKFIAAGFPAQKLLIKPNFVDPDPGAGEGQGNFALFVGRLTEEKGIATLIEAWERIGNKLPLKICGDGPMAEWVQARASENPALEYLGRQPLDKVMELMGSAALLAFPSQWYEGHPRTIVESFAKGTPVVASQLGSMTELIEPGKTGVRFEAGNPIAMAEAVLGLIADPAKLLAMRVHCRAEYLSRYTAQANYDRLHAIYQAALVNRRSLDSNPTLSALDPSFSTPQRAVS